jgi:hypothetical protein
MYSRVRIIPITHLSQSTQNALKRNLIMNGARSFSAASVTATPTSTSSTSTPIPTNIELPKKYVVPEPTEPDLMKKHLADVMFPQQANNVRAWKTVLVVNYNAVQQYDSHPNLVGPNDPKPILANGKHTDITSGISANDTYKTNINVEPTPKEIFKTFSSALNPGTMGRAWKSGRFGNSIGFPLATFVSINIIA